MIQLNDIIVNGEPYRCKNINLENGELCVVYTKVVDKTEEVEEVNIFNNFEKATKLASAPTGLDHKKAGVKK
jgi:hypothetical protein